MSVLTLTHVSRSRGRGRRLVQVLRDITLDLSAGEVVLLEGPSGSGKTTLLGVAAGLLSPEAGDVILDGHHLAAETPARRRAIRARYCGLVFQRSNLLAGLTARQNVLLMAEIAGMGKADADSEADRLFAALGLAAQRDSYPAELSGGEEQRVAVARALVHRPKVVLADEPTGNLDGESGHAVAESLAALTRERSSAVLVATHDQRLAPFASRRLRLVDGRISPVEG